MSICNLEYKAKERRLRHRKLFYTCLKCLRLQWQFSCAGAAELSYSAVQGAKACIIACDAESLGA
jgi:hypothetical protein